MMLLIKIWFHGYYKENIYIQQAPSYHIKNIFTINHGQISYLERVTTISMEITVQLSIKTGLCIKDE